MDSLLSPGHRKGEPFTCGKSFSFRVTFWVEFKPLFHGNCPSMELIFEWDSLENSIMTGRTMENHVRKRRQWHKWCRTSSVNQSLLFQVLSCLYTFQSGRLIQKNKQLARKLHQESREVSYNQLLMFPQQAKSV